MADQVPPERLSAEDAAEAAMRTFEEERRKLSELHRKMDEDSSTVRAKDRCLSMTFDGRGELTAMKFLGTKFRSMAPAELAHVIVETVNEGRARSMKKLGESMGTGLPGVDFAELAAGKMDPEKLLEALLSPILGEMTEEVLGSPAKDNGAAKETGR
jgi:hypothetical protein